MTKQRNIPGGLHGRRGPSLRRVLSRCRDERGVALTEMALVLPLLLLLILGMVDFGKAINYWIDNTHLANEGARLAVVNSNPCATSATSSSCPSGNTTTLQDYLRAQTSSAEERSPNPVQGTQRSAHSMTVNICYYNGSSGALITSGTPAVGDTVEVIVKYDYDWIRGFPFPGDPTTTIGGKAAMRLEAVPTFNGWSGDIGTGTCPSGA
jgi:Flp pilus assembly protein TadG